MLKGLALLGFISISTSAFSECAVLSILPDDQINSLKVNVAVYFKTSHVYQIVNTSSHDQTYYLCNKVHLKLNNREQFLKEECSDLLLHPGKSYVMNEKMYREAYFSQKKWVNVKITTLVDGDCKAQSIIDKQIKVK